MAITLENHLLFPNSERLSFGIGLPIQELPQDGQFSSEVKSMAIKEKEKEAVLQRKSHPLPLPLPH